MKVVLTSKARKELDVIQDKIALWIASKIYQLEGNPYGLGAQKLEGEGNFRIRIGDFRVVYIVDKKNKLITIIKIAHRREVYR